MQDSFKSTESNSTMYYLKCTLHNFIFEEQLFTKNYEIIFGKLNSHGLTPFTEREMKSFCAFVQEHTDNFDNIELLTNEYQIDLYDTIRDYRLLPDTVIFDSKTIHLLRHGEVIDHFQDFIFKPLGIVLT